MTQRELREEIEMRLLFKPQSALDLARIVSATTSALGSEVFNMVASLQAWGTLLEIDGKLYVQRTEGLDDDH